MRNDAADSSAPPVLSVIVPVFDEADVLPEFHRRLANVLVQLDRTWEVVYVNDGSCDASASLLTEFARSHPVRIVELSRNFGKEAAMTAGLDHSRGEAVILIDADLQDPPEQILPMVAEWDRGADIVLMQRSSRSGESWPKKWTASQFYRVLNRISELDMLPDVGDFRLLSRRAVSALGKCRERTRFMKGLYTWIGFRRVVLRYDRDARFAGRSKWNYWRLWNFALEGITSFSTAPLKVASYAGFIVAAVAFLMGIAYLGKTLVYGDPVHGFTTLVTVLLFLGGVQLIALGVIGEYLGRVFIEVKQRPMYVVDMVHNGSMH